jgi:hypothetical protein
MAPINSNGIHPLVYITVLTIGENKFSLHHIAGILVLSNCL